MLSKSHAKIASTVRIDLDELRTLHITGSYRLGLDRILKRFKCLWRFTIKTLLTKNKGTNNLLVHARHLTSISDFSLDLSNSEINSHASMKNISFALKYMGNISSLNINTSNCHNFTEQTD